MKIILGIFILFISHLLHASCEHKIRARKSTDEQLKSNLILQSESNSENTDRQNLDMADDTGNGIVQSENLNPKEQNNIPDNTIVSRKKKKFKLTDQSYSIVSSQPGDDISFIFVGDIMMGRNVGLYIANNTNNDITFPFQLVKKIITNYDLKVANLESGITNSITPLKKVIPCSESTSGCCDLNCHFKVSPDVLKGIVDYAGFNLLTIENNHIDDYENERKDTIKALINHRTAFIDYFHPLRLENFKGCNLEFYAYTFVNSQFSYDTMKNHMQDQLRNASSDSFKIYYLHGGKEYDFDPLEYQIDFAHATIDAGADMIIFSHTHVIGQHEIYNNKHIVYGLGNFIFDQREAITKKFYTLTFDLQNCQDVANFKLINGTLNSRYQPSFNEQ